MVAHRSTIFRDPDTWWAFSQSHGWVVMDKTLPQNRGSVLTEAFRFIRCRDWFDYEQPWNYKEAGRYLDSLTPAEAAAAETELAALQAAYQERV